MRFQRFALGYEISEICQQSKRYLPEVRCARWTFVGGATSHAHTISGAVLPTVRRWRVRAVPETFLHASSARSRTIAVTKTISIIALSGVIVMPSFLSFFSSLPLTRI